MKKSKQAPQAKGQGTGTWYIAVLRAMTRHNALQSWYARDGMTQQVEHRATMARAKKGADADKGKGNTDTQVHTTGNEKVSQLRRGPCQRTVAVVPH